MTKLIALLALVPSLALAAPAKTVKSADTGNAPAVKSTLGSGSVADALKGLSVYASFDLADTMDVEASSAQGTGTGTYTAEKAFGFGANYTFPDLTPGIAVQAGGSYEMSRQISNIKANGTTTPYTTKPEVQLWTVYGQALARLTDRIAVYGGPNYSIPTVKNVNGGTYKGKVGYQLGGSFAVTDRFAIDGEFRTLNFSGSVTQGNATENYDNIRNQGFLIRTRYMFL